MTRRQDVVDRDMDETGTPSPGGTLLVLSLALLRITGPHASRAHDMTRIMWTGAEGRHLRLVAALVAAERVFPGFGRSDSAFEAMYRTEWQR
jgi:hypothetical protein